MSKMITQLCKELTQHFLAIDELSCHSVIRRDLCDIFMVKCLAKQRWPEGQIDLLGYLF